jgi:hypothetical protein
MDEMVKHGYVERVGNAYRVTDKVNIATCSESYSSAWIWSWRLRENCLSWLPLVN